MKKRCRRSLVLSVVMLSVALLTPVHASDTDSLQESIDALEETQQELQEQMESAQSDADALEDSLTEAEEEVAALTEEKEALEASMQELDDQIGEAAAALNDISTQQEAKQEEIDETDTKLAEAQETEKKQYENMKLRIRYMYEQGTQNYLAVLLSAADAADLLNRAEYITSIYKYDRDMLAEYAAAKEAVAEQQALLETQYEELEALKAQADEQLASLEALQEEKNAELASYNELIASTQALADAYQEQLDAVEELIAGIEAAANEASEQQAAAAAELSALLASLEDEALETAEQAAAQTVLAQLAAAAQAELEAAGESGLTVDPDTLFVWPCPSSTYISSDYGYRIHPIYGDYRLHSGIDIAADTGAAIIAAYQGTVIGAGYNSSMGNYVMIDHGEGLVTVYMHASYLCVSEGDYVETGQLIALVGATGDATGPHLHFSVRLNGTYVNPWNYVSSS